jgi:PfaD family protein
MSLAAHFDTLAAYGAMAIRILPVGGEPEDFMSDGGGLQDAFDRRGRGPLLDVFADPGVEGVVLADGELEVAMRRVGTRARLTVGWGDVTVVDEELDIPTMVAAHDGPLFRPSGPAVDRATAIADLQRPVHAVRDMDGRLRYHHDGVHGPGLGERPLAGWVAPLGPEDLGSAAFRERMGVKWAYVAGAMAGGIASADLVVAMADAGLLGFFGAGGLPVEAVEAGLGSISARARGAWGANLLHNPNEPLVEEQTVDLYLKYGVKLVSASAFMGLTPAVVRYRLHGIHRAADGRIHCPNQVFAKISRTEVAAHFLQPAPDRILDTLVANGHLTAEQRSLAAEVPIASALTAEADSGGHTDHRALVVLLPLIKSLRDELAQPGREQVFVGAAGGLGTPSAIAAAFGMGADYVLTGSVNQATVEAGTSDLVKQMLAEASPNDVATGPAPDMFELGAGVQVLSRGSMYAQRAKKLYDLYKAVGDLDAIPDRERSKLERQIFKRPLAEVWEGTRAYWATRDPAQVTKAEADPRHKMALTFRWYLGMTSRWARMGEEDRKRDYQIWCGPAMGAFNAWAAGGPLEDVRHRTVEAVATALMTGAARETRASRLP